MLGEFDYPINDGPYRMRAEQLFWQSFQELTVNPDGTPGPTAQALAELCTGPYAAFEKGGVFTDGVLDAPVHPTPFELLCVNARLYEGNRLVPYPITPEIDTFRGSLLDWLDRYDLDAARFFDHLVNVFLLWRRNPQRYGRGLNTYREGVKFFSENYFWDESPDVAEKQHTFTCTLPAWDFTGETSAAYREAITHACHEQFNAYLNAYLQKVREQATRRGYLRNAVKSHQLEKHITWFVLRHVAGWRYRSLAEHEPLEQSVSEQNIMAAVAKIAQLLDIIPRNDPKKKKIMKLKRKLSGDGL